ncbi:MAG: aminotransferase class V-fold PLP-dependent enzyme [bacterium]|nr:aminotransferase class V-fold PLP-dependent enzyme [bacterium]
MPTDLESKELAQQALRALERLGLEFLDNEATLPPRDLPAEEISARLGIALGPEGRPFEEVVAKLGRVLDATPSSSSPRFLNQLFGGREPAATLAEMLVPLADTSMYTYKVAGAQVLVELEVLARLLAAVPFPEGEGTFCPGGSLANLTAMLLARNEVLGSVRDKGFQGERLSMYSSSDSHYSIRKAAGILGLGRDSVREVTTDADGKMSTEELAESIEADRQAGWRPFFINATAGTTVLGAVDPIAEIAEIARTEGIWLHVDGALGAPVLLSGTYRHLLAGSAEADSLAWNAHKMMGVPLACSVLLLRQKGLLARHLGESANYLFQADQEELNPGTRSLQCGRRSDALKLWAAWQHHGDRGLDRKMTRLLDLARYAARIIEEDPQLELARHPETVNVCFRVPGVSSEELCDHLDRQGILKIGHGTVAGESAVRLVCVSPDLDEDRIVTVLGEIKAAARALTEERRRAEAGRVLEDAPA